MQRVTALLTATAVIMTGATLGTDAQTRRDRFRMHGETDTEQTPSVDARGAQLPAPRTTEAPTGFDNETNGFLRQGPPFETIDEDNVVPLRSFNDNRFIFEEVEVVADGLGPIYNAQSCGECHQNVATGGASQIAEHRTGRLMGDEFFESLGGSLVHSRATHPDIVEPVVYEDSIRTFRISTNTLGAGYVEAIANTTLLRIRERAACGPARLRRTRARARGRGAAAHRAVRLEEPAFESPVVRRGRVSQRDGHYEPAIPDREHLERPRRQCFRPRAPIRRTTASTSRRSRISCVRRRHRHAARSTRRSWQAKRSSRTSAARRVT